MENKQSIQIRVAVKNMGNIAKRVAEHPFVLERTPRTLRDFIEECVKTCVKEYNKRASGASAPSPLTEGQYDAMREIGKFAFGVHYNQNTPDLQEAINTALEAVSDGLVRIFKGNIELTELDEKIEITENELFTLIRLTMLSGRMW